MKNLFNLIGYSTIGINAFLLYYPLWAVGIPGESLSFAIYVISIPFVTMTSLAGLYFRRKINFHPKLYLILLSFQLLICLAFMVIAIASPDLFNIIAERAVAFFTALRLTASPR